MTELRKLHLRWWHATKEEMARAPRAANIPRDILDLIPNVVNNCLECRKWALPEHQTVPTLRRVRTAGRAGLRRIPVSES